MAGVQDQGNPAAGGRIWAPSSLAFASSPPPSGPPPTSGNSSPSPPRPRPQPRGRRPRQPLQHVAKLTPRLDAQPLARGHEAKVHRRRLAAAWRPDRQPVFTTNSNPLHLAFGRVIVDGQEPGLGVTHQRGPV